MSDFHQKLKEYAALLVRAGMNVQKGQTVAILADLDCAPLVRLCTEEAYAAGAREVITDWGDAFCTRQKYLWAAPSAFEEVPAHVKGKYDYYLEQSCALLSITGNDPELLAGVEPGRILSWKKAFGAATEPFHIAMTGNKFQWCVAAWPTQAWAKKVFPALSAEEAQSALWDAIFSACRVSGEGDAVARWQAHTKKQKQILDTLNRFQLQSLHYKNSLGTDLTVPLPARHIWIGGNEHAATGCDFIANIPTEEVFTAPRWDGAAGVVFSSMPLSLDGNMVRDFRLELSGGKIVDVRAGEGEQVLRNSIAMDEGSSYLGEVALVPWDSPIRNTETLFYNTLFDENASCHFAFGSAYPCVEGAADLPPDGQRALGLNQSKNHVDFMVGTPDLAITGLTADGRTVKIFEAGNFAF